jgi:hypothetical protein
MNGIGTLTSRKTLLTFDRSLLTFDAGRHRHLYDGKQLIGVTTALGMISKGDAITQWAVNQALEFLGKELQGDLTEDDVKRLLYEAKYAWKARRDEAASIGTQAHNWMESYLRGEAPEWPEHQNVRNSCEAGVKWCDLHHWETVEVEKQIFHPKYGYAGILDWWVLIDGVPSIPDWKTSKYIYSSYRYQTAAYLKALENEVGCRIEDRWILRIDKETGEFEDLKLPRKELARDWRGFRAALNLYKNDKQLKEEAKNGPRES